LPLRAAARRVTPRSGPRERDAERVGDTRQADVDFTREPMGAPEVLAEQPAARAVAFISKTRSVCAGKAAREARQRPDRGNGDARGGVARGDSWRHLARSVGKNILQSSASVVGRGARDTSSRRYHAEDRVPSLDGFETVTRGGLATRRVMARARRGPRFPAARVPDLTKSGCFFLPRNRNPASLGQSQRDCWQVSTLLGIFSTRSKRFEKTFSTGAKGKRLDF
jgi:hypothetical protein